MIGRSATVAPFDLPATNFDMAELYLDLKFHNWPDNIEINARDLEKKLKDICSKQVLSMNQSVSFEYKGDICTFTVVRIFTVERSFYTKKGMLSPTTKILFNPSSVKKMNQEYVPKIMFLKKINKEKMEQELRALGIGGMGKILSDIFERLIATRLHHGLKMEHVKGILLYGPPGTGKTLLAAKLAELLDAKLKVVNGPELLTQWVGESEQNVRRLFHEAESDYKTYEEQSPLHVVILDEIDSVAQKRGRNPADSGSDRVVNQLLAMINGVNKLNNILIVGTTNRKDLIDDALLRSGRLELHIEIGLPDEASRQDILKIHVEQLPKEIMLHSDVDLQQIAARTSGLSGADLASLVKHAISHALCMTPDKNDQQVKVSQQDFVYAIDEKWPAAYKESLEAFENLRSGAIMKLDSFSGTINQIEEFMKPIFQSKKHHQLTCLLLGPSECGKTTLAAFIPEKISFQYVAMVTPISLMELSTKQKVEKVVQVFKDAKKFKSSFILLDELERLVEYNPLRETCSDVILNTLLVLLREPQKGNKMLVVGTTNNESVVEKMGFSQVFTLHLQIPLLQQQDICKVYKYFDAASMDEMDEVEEKLNGMSLGKLCKLIDIASMGNLQEVLDGTKRIDIKVFLKYQALLKW